MGQESWPCDDFCGFLGPWLVDYRDVQSTSNHSMGEYEQPFTWMISRTKTWCFFNIKSQHKKSAYIFLSCTPCVTKSLAILPFRFQSVKLHNSRWELDNNPTGALNWKVSETNNSSGNSTDTALAPRIFEFGSGFMDGFWATSWQQEMDTKQITNMIQMKDMFFSWGIEILGVGFLGLPQFGRTSFHERSFFSAEAPNHYTINYNQATGQLLDHF